MQKLNPTAMDVLTRRYLSRDAEGKVIETVEDMFRRVAAAIAEQDKNYAPEADIAPVTEEFFEMMTSLRFLPNSPTLMNAGKPLGQLSACFVLPVEDSMEKIFEAIKQAALIHKSGGGTGFSFSRLRPAGSVVNSTGGVASGPISFMKVFNTATEAVKQGGTRRGANMGMLRIDHPDILEFIDCKENQNEITNFNISVAITEAFMEAASKGQDYDLIDPRTRKPVGKLNAKEVYDRIVDAAWRNGEPGIVFIDRLNRDNVVPSQGEIESTNPCGEQPLLPYESCNLGSINLMKMMRDGAIDYQLLGETVDSAIHFLDNVIDANKYPIEEIDHTTKLTRKVGLGVMGWADMLLTLGVPYNSDEAVELAGKVMGFITARARRMSQKLAETRGAFPLFAESIYKDGPALRNATVTTIAPTGTLSIIAGVSSGVEPVFAYAFVRNIMDGTRTLETSPVLKDKLEQEGIYSDELMERVIKDGTLAHIDELPEDIRKVFVSAHDVTPIWHTRMQAAFQDHTDNAVSKTVNFPNSATREDVREVYDLAWKLGCKGVTIYRDGSRFSQVLSAGADKKEEPAAPVQPVIEPRERPEVVMGITEKVKIGCGNLYVTVNYDENGICEVFTNTGRHGGCPSQSEATGRLASMALRSGVPVKNVIEQLKGIRCPSTIRQQGMKVLSCPDAIARVIEKVNNIIMANKAAAAGEAILEPIDKKKPVKAAAPAAEVKAAKPAAKKEEKAEESVLAPVEMAVSKPVCPECGAELSHEGGCVVCYMCGYSKCN